MIAVIGAGISGLTLAYYLKKAGKEFVIFEKSTVGGLLQTKQVNGRVFDLGANSLILNKEAEALIKDLNLESSVCVAHESSENRYIIHQNKLLQLPSKPQDLLKTDLISWRSKFKVLKELFGLFKKKKSEDETVEDFFLRHFGKEITEKFVYAFVNGIYSLNPDELDLKMTFPKLNELENKYGSILKGFRKERSLDRMKSINFVGGFETLVGALSSQIDSNLIPSEVKLVEKTINEYSVEYQDEQGVKSQTFDKIVFCTDLKSTEKLIQNFSFNVKSLFTSTHTLSINTINLVYKKSAVGKSINGFGALGTVRSGVAFSGVINVSQTFPQKLKNNDEVMFTVMIKGDQFKYNDNQLIEICHNELSELLFIEGEPLKQELFRWKNALPKYNKELRILNQELAHNGFKNVYFNSNWVAALSIKDCISKSKEISTLL